MTVFCLILFGPQKIVSNTSTCAELTSGCQFSVRVRAQPDGVNYSGFWSDWSDVFSGATTHDTGKTNKNTFLNNLNNCLPAFIRKYSSILLNTAAQLYT